MLYDECQHHSPALYCFDTNHGHHTPAFIYEGDEKLLKEFHELSDSYNKDFLYGGESIYDLEYKHYSVSYTRIGENHIPSNRYIDPHVGLMVAAIGFDDREMLNQCLAYRYIISYEPYNFKGRLDDFPLTLEYGKKIDELRRRYKDYIWDGDFMAGNGATVLKENGDTFDMYSVYLNTKTGKRAVIVVNNNIEQLNLTVKLDGNAGNLVYASPEQPEETDTNGNVEIAPRSALVIMEK